MESIKAAVGLGKKDQEGQEPVSGVKGEGTAGEPFDQGNQESDPDLGGKAPQETDPSAVTGEVATETKAADEATTSGKSEAAPAPLPTTTTTNTDSEASPKAPESDKKPTIGSAGWFKTAIPLGKRKEESNDQQATGGAVDTSASQETNTQETASRLPPNHLGEDVPAGLSTEDDPNIATMAGNSTPTALNPSTDPQARAADGEAQEAALEPPNIAVTSDEENQAPKKDQPTSSGGGGGGLFSNPFKSAGNNEDVSVSTAAKRRSSREAYGSNPNAIPIAGGMRVGSVAQERRMSTLPSSRKSIEQPKIHESVFEEGSEATTAVGSEGAYGVDPMEKKFGDSADGLKEMRNAHADAPPPKASEETPRNSSVGSPPSHDRSRRKSIFDKVKEKLK